MTEGREKRKRKRKAKGKRGSLGGGGKEAAPPPPGGGSPRKVAGEKFREREKRMLKIIQKFPNVSKGVLVEKVIEGSPAERAGILDGDVIVQCARNNVRSFLEFCGIIWDKTAGKSEKLVVIRATSGDRLKLKVKLEETRPDKFYRWPLPEKCMVAVKRVRM